MPVEIQSHYLIVYYKTYIYIYIFIVKIERKLSSSYNDFSFTC